MGKKSSKKLSNSNKTSTIALSGYNLSANKKHETQITITRTAGFNLWPYSDNAAYNSATDHFASYSIALSDIGNYSDLTKLYQEYCIKRVEFFFVPNKNVDSSYFNGTTVVTNTIPDLFAVYDPTDVSAPTAISQLFDYSTCYESRLDKKVSIQFKPMFQRALYEGPVSTGYEPSTGWISTADPSVPHYGLKVALRTVGQAQGTISVYARVVLGLKIIH